jgi:hypothetical protein
MSRRSLVALLSLTLGVVACGGIRHQATVGAELTEFTIAAVDDVVHELHDNGLIPDADFASLDAKILDAVDVGEAYTRMVLALPEGGTLDPETVQAVIDALQTLLDEVVTWSNDSVRNRIYGAIEAAMQFYRIFAASQAGAAAEVHP